MAAPTKQMRCSPPDFESEQLGLAYYDVMYMFSTLDWTPNFRLRIPEHAMRPDVYIHS